MCICSGGDERATLDLPAASAAVAALVAVSARDVRAGIGSPRLCTFVVIHTYLLLTHIDHSYV
jgi:hypothetical protein